MRTLKIYSSNGFGFNSLSDTECNFVLRDSRNETKILASFIEGVLEIFNNSVYIENEFPEMNESGANKVLREQYLQPRANAFITDMNEKGEFNYLCVECDYLDAKLTLQNFLDCYGELVIETI